MGNGEPVLFQETLRGVPKWLGVVLVGLGGICAGGALFLARAEFGDPLFWVGAVPGLLAAVLVPLLLALWTLETTVRPSSLTVHLRPFRRREIPLRDIESCEARVYRPIGEFLGWGWRVGPSGQALTVPGRHGVQLVLTGGARLLISSSRSEELAGAIRSARRNV